MTAPAPTVLRIGWRRSWIAPHVRRRLLAALLASAGVLLALSSIHRPAAGSFVVVASRDLAAGTRLTSADVSVVTLPADAVPAGTPSVASALIGQVISGPVRAREPLTDLRLQVATGVTGLSRGLVAAPIRLADAAVAPLLHPGARIDVLAAGSSDLGYQPGATSGAAADASAASVVAEDVQVISIPAPPTDATGSTTVASGGTLVVLAVTRSQARALASAEAAAKLSVTLRGG